MYNGIGLTTPRGSGTNGFVTRNLSAVRKTKEKVVEYTAKEDAAVRPYDVELLEHEKRRQAEVRCMELRELLEEQELPDDEIEEKVNSFRAKLLAEKKSSILKDASGRPLVKDSHELSMAQEQKNERAKNAFGIKDNFVPGSSMESVREKEKLAAEIGKEPNEPSAISGKSKEKDRKRKKSKHHRKRRSSSSSSSSSSTSSSSSDDDDDSRRKRRKKDKKKKSKKSSSRHHHKRNERSRSREDDRQRSKRR